MAEKETPANFARKYPRKAYTKSVSFLTEGKSNFGQGVEIGEGGLAFSTQVQFAENTQFIVNFFLTDKDFFSVRATIKNITHVADQFTYGVSFDDISIALKRQIRAYVARTSQA